MMDLIGTFEVKDGRSSFAVFRPVPHPSSVIEIGVEDERRANAWSRSVGRRASSIAWRMLPSVSYTCCQLAKVL